MIFEKIFLIKKIEEDLESIKTLLFMESYFEVVYLASGIILASQEIMRTRKSERKEELL